MQIVAGKVLNCYQLIQNTSWKQQVMHHVKSVLIQSFSGLYCPVWTEYGKIQIAKAPYFIAFDQRRAV